MRVLCLAGNDCPYEYEKHLREAHRFKRCGKEKPRGEGEGHSEPSGLEWWRHWSEEQRMLFLRRWQGRCQPQGEARVTRAVSGPWRQGAAGTVLCEAWWAPRTVSSACLSSNNSSLPLPQVPCLLTSQREIPGHRRPL